jgi:hypothetical protein
MEFKELIPLLRLNGVKKFKGLDLEIEFEPKDLDQNPLKAAATPAPPGVPPEIHDPDLMNADAIRNWSAPASPTDGPEFPLPLTGEEPPELNAEVG